MLSVLILGWRSLRGRGEWLWQQGPRGSVATWLGNVAGGHGWGTWLWQEGHG